MRTVGEDATTESETYAVAMAPVGTVAFERPPASVEHDAHGGHQAT